MTVANYNRQFQKHLVKLVKYMDTNKVGEPVDREALLTAANDVDDVPPMQTD